MGRNSNHSHLHLRGWSVSEQGQVILNYRSCALAGRRAHQPFGPLYFVPLGDEFFADPDVQDAANAACHRLELDAQKAAAMEGLDLDAPLPGM